MSFMVYWRKATVISLVAALLLCACRKNGTTENSPQYHLKAKFDGQWKEFSKNVFSDKIENAGIISKLDVTGYQGDDSSSPSLDFEIWGRGGASIGTGTYSEPANNILCRYSVQTASGTVVYGSQQNINDMSIVINELTPKYVRGTFNGTLTLNGGVRFIKITDGSFYAPLE